MSDIQLMVLSFRYKQAFTMCHVPQLGTEKPTDPLPLSTDESHHMNILIELSDIFIMQITLHSSMLKWLWCFSQNSFIHDRLNGVSILFCLSHQQDTLFFITTPSPTFITLIPKHSCLHLHNDVIERISYGFMCCCLFQSF